MSPKEILKNWVTSFNEGDAEKISNLYSQDAINYQVALEHSITGKQAIKEFFEWEFDNYEMECIPENIFEDGNVGILEWKDPKGLRGCGFFWFEDDKITYQRGYWDRQTFEDQQAKIN